jgi:hypothetical protein
MGLDRKACAHQDGTQRQHQCHCPQKPFFHIHSPQHFGRIHYKVLYRISFRKASNIANYRKKAPPKKKAFDCWHRLWGSSLPFSGTTPERARPRDSYYYYQQIIRHNTID